MKKVWLLALSVAAGCSSEPKKDAGGALEAYRSECAAARTACERGANSAGMEKGTHGLAEFLDLWAEAPATKPPPDAAENARLMREGFTVLEALLKSGRALADGSRTDEEALDAFDAAVKEIRATIADIRGEVKAVDMPIRDFAKRDPQSKLSRQLLLSVEDVPGVTLPNCENAARALSNARSALQRYLDAK